MSRACPQCGTSFADDAFFCGFDGTITIEEQSPDDFDRRLGARLGDYVVVARVADGAMGRVYEGRHATTRERVAIKVLHDSVLEDEVAVERFRREYETANEFDHPYIVKVVDFGETEDGSYFMTMEYLEGEELSQLVKRENALSPARAVRLMSQLGLGLHYAHSFGVVHRDLKPDNVFVCKTDEGDVVRILDFGSVKLQMETGPKLTAMGTTLGSPYYMSPEQAMGKLDVDQRTDVFAQGAIMFEIATGEVAFEGDNIAEILMRIVQHEPPPVSASNDVYPAAYDSVVSKAIHKDKEQRYGTSVELVGALLTAFGLEPDAERWANATLEEIEGSMGASTPSKRPKAAPKVSVPPPTAAAAKVAAAPRREATPSKTESQPAEVETDFRDSILTSPPKRRRSRATTFAIGALAVGIVVTSVYLLLS